MLKTLEDFYKDLGFSESSGRYNVVNDIGFAGKYQMGEAAMIEAGYYKKKKNIGNNDWSGQFTGKDGVYSLKDFLNNPVAQENANLEYKRKQWKELISNGSTNYIGKTVGGIPITASGLLGAGHLGTGYVINFLKSGGKNDKTDAYGTSVSKYLKKFQNYDVAPLTNPDYKIPQINSEFNQPNVNYGGLHQIPSRYDTNHEKTIKSIQNLLNPLGLPTGQAAGIDIEQLAQQLGLQPQPQYTQYVNPINDSNRIYTREEIGQMSGEEFAQHEKAIMRQLKDRGIPMRREVSHNKSSSKRGNSDGSNSQDGHWVTINGNHVLMKD